MKIELNLTKMQHEKLACILDDKAHKYVALAHSKGLYNSNKSKEDREDTYKYFLEKADEIFEILGQI